LISGDVRDVKSLIKAAEGMDIVLHLAAGVRGTKDFILESCIEGTKNVAEAARIAGIKRVVYMSSMAVYDYLKLRNGEVISEQTPLEEFPDRRGDYSLGKRLAEDVALSHLEDRAPSWTILRPSMIVDKRQDIFSPIGIKLGNFLICLSRASKNLRLIHLEDVGSAIINLIQNDGTRGHVFTLSSDGSLKLHDYINGYIRTNGFRDIHAVHIPYWFASLGVLGLMALRKLTGKGPSMNMRRLAYIYRDVRVSNNGIRERTGWQPGTGLLERLVKERSGS